MKDFILKQMTAIVLPFVFVFGFYVILHGHVSAGGSFAGGIIVGLSIVAHSTIYGVKRGRGRLSENALTYIDSYATLWYGLMGLAGIAVGAPFLANKSAGISLGTSGNLFSGGLIFLISLGVGIRVANTVITLFFMLMDDEKEKNEINY